jgi:hypothetical protein
LAAAGAASLPDVPTTIRKLPAALVVGVEPLATVPAPMVINVAAAAQAAPATIASAAPAVPSAVVAPAAHRPIVAPLAPERYRLRITMAQETHDTLRELQDLLAREIPGGDAAVIVDRALTLLLADVKRRKVGAAAHPRAGRESKAIPRVASRGTARPPGTGDGGKHFAPVPRAQRVRE